MKSQVKTTVQVPSKRPVKTQEVKPTVQNKVFEMIVDLWIIRVEYRKETN